MSDQDTPSAESLQLWLPSDSFNHDYNRTAFQSAISDLQLLDVVHVPGESQLFCTSTDERTLYETVDEAGVRQRMVELRDDPAPITSCLQPDQRIDNTPEELTEEARVRTLHLALGRTGFYLAVEAERREDFEKATQDIQRVFSMLTQPVHSLEELSDTLLHKQGLLYLFVLAARRHKTITPEAATTLMDTLNQGIVPQDNGRTWAQERGKGFVDRISFVPKKLVYPKQARQNRERALAGNRAPVVRLKPEAPIKRTAKAKAFIARLLKTSQTGDYEKKLNGAHEKFLGDEPEEFDIPNNVRMEIGKLGVEAYLECMSKYSSDAAGQMLRYLSRRRSNYKFGLLPLLVLGNMVTAKINAGGGFDGSPSELPGLGIKGLPLGFRAVRYALSHAGLSEGEDEQKLGDVVETYLAKAFPAADEQVYEILEAPEGVERASIFATRHGISKAVLDATIGKHGIDAGNYRFGSLITKGLTPDEQEFIESMLDEIRVEPAPPGHRSVSSFAHINGVTKPRVDGLILKHEIETGRYGIKGKPAVTLSPEAQTELEAIINRNPRKRRKT